MDKEEMKKLVKQAVELALVAEIRDSETRPEPGDAQVIALVSIAKSLAVIAGVLTEATFGRASINTYDMASSRE